MSGPESSDAEAADQAEPEADAPLLVAAYDDPASPSELTVFPADVADPRTCWLTADVDSVVSLDAAT